MENKQKWENYGDINFLTYGGCLVKADDYKDCFHVLVLNTDIDTDEEEKVIVAKCFIDLSDWLEPEDDGRKKVNSFVGYEENYIPQTEDEKMSYCVDLINYYGLHNFDPDFPKETGCGCYALGTITDWIVDKEIAIRFMKEYDVPEEFLK